MRLRVGLVVGAWLTKMMLACRTKCNRSNSAVLASSQHNRTILVLSWGEKPVLMPPSLYTPCLQAAHKVLQEEHSQLLSRQTGMTSQRSSLRQQLLTMEEQYMQARNLVSMLSWGVAGKARRVAYKQQLQQFVAWSCRRSPHCMQQ